MISFSGLVKKITAAAIVSALLTVSVAAVEVGTVNTGALNVRSSNSTSASVLAVAPRGEKVIILEKNGNWYRVKYNYEEGYMAAEYVLSTDTADFSDSPVDGVVTGSVVNVRSKPSTDNPVVFQLRQDSYAKVIGVEDGWYKIKYGTYVGYIHPDYFEIKKNMSENAASAANPSSDGLQANSAESASVSGKRNEVVEFAKQYLGTKYTYGGRSPSKGFDCSGFVYYVFKNFGHTLNPGASNQMNRVSSISKGDLLPGDLVFFNAGSSGRASHVGIYIGNNQFIHAVKPGKTLSISSLGQAYYTRYYVGAGRVLT